MNQPPSNETILSDLEPTAERLLNRHLQVTKEWFPHELVPWSRGRDFTADEIWDSEEFPIAPGVRSALLINLLTEENLPHYYAALDRLGLRDGPWGEWSRRWTAEEARHGAVIRDYVLVTRALDAHELECERMHAMTQGFDGAGYPLIDAVVYAALQELATRVAHRNTGKRLNDPSGYRIMTRISGDENLHFLFYRDLVEALLKCYPSMTVSAIKRQVSGFKMPGTAIRQFSAHSRAIAAEGIYDLDIHYHTVLEPLLYSTWGVEDAADLASDAERDRDQLFHYLARVQRIACRVRERKPRGGDCSASSDSDRDRAGQEHKFGEQS